MKRFTLVAATFGLVLGLCGVAIAHGSAHQTIMGTINAVVETEMVVTTEAEGHVPITLKPSTRYVTTRNNKGSWGDLGEGMRVIVKLDDQGRTADEVRYRSAVSPTPEQGAQEGHGGHEGHNGHEGHEGHHEHDQ